MVAYDCKSICASNVIVIFDFAARQDNDQNDEQFALEAERLKYALLQSEEEKKRLEDEVAQVIYTMENYIFVNNDILVEL